MINPIVFTYKKDELKEVGEQQGVIAQELEKVFPYMVTEGQKTFEDGETIDDFKTINTSPLIYVCVNAIKELSDNVDKLEKKISDMGK